VASLLESWREMGKHDAEIVAVLVSESPDREPDSDQWRPYRKRDEMWLAGRGLVDPGEAGRPRVRLRVDDRTLGQLRAPRYATNAAGATIVESKASMRRRGLPSPDRGEACLLAVYEPRVHRSRLVV
jgi:hypothetical protein